MKVSRQDRLSTSKDKIIRFLTEGDIVLSADDERILTRLETADRLLQEKKSFNDIVKSIVDEHGVSRFTAQNDVFTAQEVFGQARKIDKRYVLFLKYQRQEEDIERIRRKIFNMDRKEGEEEGWFMDPKDIMALAKLEEAITYTLNSFPSDMRPPTVKRPVWMLTNINFNNAAPMPFNDAMAKADEMIIKLKANEGAD